MGALNPCPYSIQTFSYVPKKKVKSLSKRQQSFKDKLWSSIGKTFKDYPKDMILDFCEYWFENNGGETKMRFEREKVFNHKRRIQTWKKNQSIFTPKKEPVKPTNVYPGKYQLGGRSNETRPLNEIIKR